MVTIEYLRDTFKIGMEAFRESRQEAEEVWNLYHNKHYTEDQLNILQFRGQPAETFNVVKMFGRLLVGYYSQMVSDITILGRTSNDITGAALLQDVIKSILIDNNFEGESQQLKLEAIISGVLCSYTDIYDTGKVDEYGRPIYDISVEYVPSNEIVMDPAARRADHKDARFIHRFRWLHEEQVKSLFGVEKFDELVAYYNYTGQEEAEWQRDHEVGQYKMHDNFLIVHSITRDYKGTVVSTFWHNNTILKQTDITNKWAWSPYSVTRIHEAEASYYGIFHDVIETQKAINQALLKLQLLVNVQKVFVEESSIDNLAQFTAAVNRVSAVIPVRSLAGIKVENLSNEAIEQYQIIDRALDRIQRVLGVNDAFLGMAYSADSGRKVKLQQQAASIALQYLTTKLETHYRLIGTNMVKLIQQYFVAHQFLTLTEPNTGQRFLELNAPLQIPTGEVDAMGNPITELAFEQVMDPATGEPLVTEEGELVYAPIPIAHTELMWADVKVEVTTSTYDADEERTQLMLEQILAGPTGQILMQVNPAGYFQIASLSIKNMRTRFAPDIAEVYAQTAAALGGDPEAEQQAQMMAMGMPGALAQQSEQQSGGHSRTLNLPQNTRGIE